MSALEIRLIAYVIVGLAWTGFTSWTAVTLTNHHRDRVEAAEKLAQAAEVQAQQAKTIAAQAAQKAAEDRADQEKQKREQVDADSRNAVLGSMHNLETAVNRHLLPAAVVNPGAVQTSQPGAGRDSRVEELLGRFNASLDWLIGACQNDSADRAAIISLEPKVSP